MYTISFTGYRPEKMPFFSEDDPMCEELKERLEKQITKAVSDGASVFYTGMARGVDTWCAEIVLKLKEKLPDIKLCAVIPCRTQSKGWEEGEALRYNEILDKCDKVICVSETYTKNCMMDRNRALVDLCDVLIAVYDGQKGGTSFTVKYAQKKGKKVIIVPVM